MVSLWVTHKPIGELMPNVREQIANDLQAIRDNYDDQPGILTAYVLVAEWLTEDGVKQLSRVSSNATGDRELPEWARDGMLAFAAKTWNNE